MDRPAHGVKRLTRVVLALRRLGRHQRQIGGDKGLFVITDIAGVDTSNFHTSGLLNPKLHNTLWGVSGTICRPAGL